LELLYAREMFKRVPAVKKPLWGGERWSKGSCISTVGRHGSEKVLRQYVRKQGTEQADSTLHGQAIQLDVF
jgi:putative transposase